MEPSAWLAWNNSLAPSWANFTGGLDPSNVYYGEYGYYDEDDYVDRPPPPYGPPPGPPPGAPPPPPPPPTGHYTNYNQPKTIHFVSVGIVLPLGFFFNTVACAVFITSRTLRNTTTGHYLLALSIADTLFLVGEFIRWLNTPNMAHLGWYIDFLDRYNVICKLVMSLRYIAKLASAWITVVITVERFITVAYPLKVVTISTPKIAKVTICLIFLVSVAGGCFPMWTVGVQVFNDVPMCVIYMDMHPTYNIFNWIFLRAGSLIMPGILISVFCTLIAIYLKRAKTVRQRKLSTNSTASFGKRTPTRGIERQLTMMLLAVALAFIFLRLPYTIAYYLHSYRVHIFGHPVDPKTNYILFYALKISDIFATVNYATNFFLYCWCGSSFRKTLKVLFLCKKKSRWQHSRDTGSSFMSQRSREYEKVELTVNGNRLPKSMITRVDGEN